MSDDFWSTVNRVVTGAAAYITDERGRVLLVDPNYRDHWSMPGGIIDAGEHPAQACAREVMEEVGLTVEVGPLLTVSWLDGLPNIPYPLVNFVFDCGEVPSDTPITLQASELDDYGFFTVEEAKELLADFVHERLLACAAARDTGALRYLPPGGHGLVGQQG
ncbi:ADP-ribose pyrophosphatase YjhB, NUDIX family [Nonomuraea solani]|uniref:ADP-ribose pyrophosphatase YjhB, NUDIX family n=1 Tax=Nonomuraea solani TaxID=1144553 RepID=A0A1H6CTU6_9ACTN|nr:NUDIX hydrolase [Nonomuraea solani]SEG75826.1 ADP-ribose pyrophosphatase YjhB, NUDIX family [Nonomuraea solani]